MRIRSLRQTVAAVAIAATSVLTVGTATAPVQAATATAQKAKNPLPAIRVTDVASGKTVALQGTFNGTKPVLVWFWAPH